MMKRKLLSLLIVLLASTFTTALYIIVSSEEPFISFPALLVIIAMYLIPISILYGLPISLLAEKLTKKLTSVQRSVTSFLIHVSFGAAFIFIYAAITDSFYLSRNFIGFLSTYEMFFMASLLTSICFWGANELLHFFTNQKNHSSLSGE